MGFAPAQIDAMAPWQFQACVRGWNRAHGGDTPKRRAMSADRAAELGIEGF